MRRRPPGRAARRDRCRRARPGPSIVDHSSSARSSCRRASAKANAAAAASPARIDASKARRSSRAAAQWYASSAQWPAAIAPLPGPALCERLGEGPMEALALAGQEVVVGRLLEQRVAERVVASPPSASTPVTRTWPPTAVRSASRRSASSRPATRASRSWSTRRPATAATPMTGLGRSGSADDAGEQDLAQRRREPCPAAASSPAASSSSTKNGLPSERRWIWSARSGAGGAPRMAASSSIVSPARAARGPAARPGRSGRAPPATAAAGGGGAARRPGRSSTRTTRSVRSWRIRNAIVSRVAGIGPVEVLDDEQDRPISASRWSTPRTASSSRAWSDSVCGRACPSRGRARATARGGRDPASADPTTVSSWSSSSSRASPRSASTIGPYGTPPSPMSAQPPQEHPHAAGGGERRCLARPGATCRRRPRRRRADGRRAGDARHRGPGRSRRAPSRVRRASG